MNIAVTGGGGFIGHAVKHVAEQNGDTVMMFDRSNGHDIMGNLCALDGAESVIHLAGMLGTSELFESVDEAIDVNIKGTVRILDWCRYNHANYVGITMPDSNWANIYQATKLCAMRLATAWHVNFGVGVSHVRAFNAYGPGQKYGPGHPQKFIPTFATMAWNNLPIPIWGSGNQTVDAVDVYDVARMLVDATEWTDDQVFDAGTGIPITINEIAEFVIKETGSTGGVRHFRMRMGEVPDTQIVATGDGWDLLGWKPEMDWDALRTAIHWYKPLTALLA
jgi:UDP-glucose 4-epimerase